MSKTKVHTHVSNLVLVCLSLLFIPVSTSSSAVLITDTQEPVIVSTQPAEEQLSKTHELDPELKNIIDSIPRKLELPELPKPEPDIHVEPLDKALYADNISEYYKKRAETWEAKDVPNMEPITTLTADEINLIERLVECELTGNSQELYYGKLAIANVILNRYRSDYWEFPDTIKEVIYQKNQFSPASSGRINTIKVTDLTKAVVKDALNGVMIIEPDVYFFCTLTTGSKERFENKLDFYGHFSGHDFYSLK